MRGYVLTLHERMPGSAVLIDPKDQAQLLEEGLGKADGILSAGKIQGIVVSSPEIIRQVRLELLLTAARHFPEIRLLKTGEVSRWGLRPMHLVEVEAEEVSGEWVVISVEGMTDPEAIKKLPYYGDFRLEKEFASQRVPIERIEEIAISPPSDIAPAQLRDVRKGGVTLMRILSYFAPLLEGMFLLISGPEKSGKSFAMKMVLYLLRWLILLKQPDLQVVFLSVGERGDELGELQRLVRGHPSITFFGTSMDDLPTSKWFYMALLALERAKRFLELGKNVYFFVDSLSRLATGVSLSVGDEARASGGHTISALVQPRAFLGVAGVYPLHPVGPSCTVLVTALRESSRWDEAPTIQMAGTSTGDWCFTSAAHQHPKLNVANGLTSTRNLSWVELSDLERWFVEELKRRVIDHAEEGGRFNLGKALAWLVNVFQAPGSTPCTVAGGWYKAERKNELFTEFKMGPDLTHILIDEWDLDLEEVLAVLEAFPAEVPLLFSAGIGFKEIHQFLQGELSQGAMIATLEEWQKEWSNTSYAQAFNVKTLSSTTSDSLRGAGISVSLVRGLVAEGFGLGDITDAVKYGFTGANIREHLKQLKEGSNGGETSEASKQR